MSEESLPESEKESQSQARQHPETLDQSILLEGCYVEKKWWGFHIHFTHQLMRLLISMEPNVFHATIMDIFLGLAALPLVVDLFILTIQLRWEVMKQIDQSTGNGVRLTSPWMAWYMLIPARRGNAAREDLCWMVYGNPQETLALSGPQETIVLDVAGAAWGDDEKFPGHQSAAGASLAIYNGALFCVHRGGGNDEDLWYTVFDGDKSWQEDIRFHDHRSQGNPALAVYNNRLYCVHRGGGNDQNLWYTSFNGTSWSNDQQITPGAMSAAGPGLAVYNNRLYCVHRGGGNDQNLWYTSFGTSWSNDQRLNPWTSGQPGLTIYRDKHSNIEQLFCAFRGA